MRSGKRKVGDTLPSLRSTVNSQSCSSSQSRVSMVSGCSLSWAPEPVWPGWVATSQRAAGNAEYMARSSFGGFRI